MYSAIVLSRKLRFLLICTSLILGWSSIASAHLIAAQKGTLNVVGSKVYVVMSLPVSAFMGIGSDADGYINMNDLAAHKIEIEQAVRKGIHLGDGEEGRLTEVMLTLSPDHDSLEVNADQIVVMAVAQFKKPPQTLPLSITLFGKKTAEQGYKVSASRKAANGKTESTVAMITAKHNISVFFAAVGSN